MARLQRLLWAFFLCAVAAVTVAGQSPAQSQATSGAIGGTETARDGRTTTSLSGVVSDKDGGRIPGAIIVITHDTTKATKKTLTNNQGQYAFTDLDPGTYTITISLAQFKTVVIKDVRLLASTPRTISTTLEVGALAEKVEVTGGSELVRTETATVSQTINSEFIKNLPRADRNALNFLVFLPGVDANGQARSATISGLPQNTINISIDGVTTGNLVSGDQFFAVQRPRADAVEEVTLWLQSQEKYASIASHPFRLTLDEPLSTFGADVDTASYTNVRRFLNQGQLPPVDAVRVEELVNYFQFGYPEPSGARPVSITTEVGECPWAPTHKLALIGVRARSIDDRDIGGRNIVLLVDVSGSMSSPDKLPLVKTGLRMFVDTLRDNDRIAIVVYAGSSGMALPSTAGRDRVLIHDAIARLEAGGSTNGAEGLVLAYQIARQNFVKGGVNRVILATDGDFNVGVTSQGGLLELIEREKQSGVFLSVLGVGTGNLKDSTMEMLADKGNGHYAYLDSLQEARRVLIREGGATLQTVAKDVKFQIEFNPSRVVAWRLIGYENRAMAHQDFNNDRKDGGELGAGHTVTVLYEIVPVGDGADAGIVPGARPIVDPLKYQTPRPLPNAEFAGELLTVKVRYKQPDEDRSDVMTQAVSVGTRAPHLPLAAAVAEFGLLLREPNASAERWASLQRRVQNLEFSGPAVSERQSFATMVDLAAGLRGLRERR